MRWWECFCSSWENLGLLRFAFSLPHSPPLGSSQSRLTRSFSFLSINHVIIDVIGPTLMTNVWFLWARYSLLTSPSNTTSLQVQTLTDWFFYWVDHRASYKHSFKYFSGNENCDSTLYNIFVLSLRVRTTQSLLEINWFNWSLSKQELRAN